MEDADAIPVSALQHWAYCPRQCGLIHLEQVFEDNIHTARGRAVHHLVDEPGYEIQAGVKIERALPIWSRRLGLVGKADLVEFHPDGSVCPVEFKHGRRCKRMYDDVQVAAQAMCLEEMVGRPVPLGAVYHASSRRRREVVVTPELRRVVEETISAVRAMLNAGKLPLPANDGRCRECSLRDACEPAALASHDRLSQLRHDLFRAEDEPPQCTPLRTRCT